MNQKNEMNPLGLTGLILSIVSYFTCGLTSLPALLLSAIGCFSDKPKGTAIAGICISIPSSIFFVLIGIPMIIGFIATETRSRQNPIEAQETLDPSQP